MVEKYKMGLKTAGCEFGLNSSGSGWGSVAIRAILMSVMKFRAPFSYNINNFLFG
jgi:hypothetical protein